MVRSCIFSYSPLERQRKRDNNCLTSWLVGGLDRFSCSVCCVFLSTWDQVFWMTLARFGLNLPINIFDSVESYSSRSFKIWPSLARWLRQVWQLLVTEFLQKNTDMRREINLLLGAWTCNVAEDSAHKRHYNWALKKSMFNCYTLYIELLGEIAD